MGSWEFELVLQIFIGTFRLRLLILCMLPTELIYLFIFLYLLDYPLGTGVVSSLGSFVIGSACHSVGCF